MPEDVSELEATPSVKNCVSKILKRYHNGDWSTIVLWAGGSHERSVKRWWKESLSSEEHWWRTIHQKIGWSSNKLQASEPGRTTTSTWWCCTASVLNLGKTPQTLRHFLFSVAVWNQFTSDCSGASFWLQQGSRGTQTSGTEQKFSKNTSFNTVFCNDKRELFFECKDAYNM